MDYSRFTAREMAVARLSNATEDMVTAVARFGRAWYAAAEAAAAERRTKVREENRRLAAIRLYVRKVDEPQPRRP